MEVQWVRIRLEVGEGKWVQVRVSPEEGPWPGPQAGGKGPGGCGCVCTRLLPEQACTGRWEEGEGPGTHLCRRKAGGRGRTLLLEAEREISSAWQRGGMGRRRLGAFSAPQRAALRGRAAGWDSWCPAAWCEWAQMGRKRFHSKGAKKRARTGRGRDTPLDMAWLLSSPLLCVAVAVQGDDDDDDTPEFSGKVMPWSSLTTQCSGAGGAAWW